MTSKGALRQQRYRERRRNERDGMTPSPASLAPSPVAQVTHLLSALCDAIENVEPMHVVEASDPIALIGLAGDAELCSAWLGAVATLAGAAVKRGRPG